MKRSLFGAIALSIAAVGFGACSGDDPDATSGPGGTGGTGGQGGTGGDTTSTTGANTGGAGGAGGGQGGAGGAPKPGAIGDACTDGAACESAACLTEAETGWPGGYCTDGCNAAQPCPSGSECVSFQSGDDYCLASCDINNDNCKAGYACFDLGNGIGVCAASCTDDAQCTELPQCNVDQGLCVADEVCDDGVDNDGDGGIDCSDSDCEATCGPLITAACMGAKAAQASNMGDTSADKDIFSAPCTGAGAPETLYSFTPPADGQLTLNFDSTEDMGVYIRTKCDDPASEIGCANDLGPDTLSVLVKGGQELTIFVDGYADVTHAGPFTMDLLFEAAMPEDCTDGKDNDFDQLFDCDDADCDATCGPLITAECATATPLVAGMTPGDTTMGTSLFSGSCGGSMGAKEDVYSYTAAATGELKLSLASMMNHGLYARTTCSDAKTEIACANSAAGGAAETLTVGLMAGQMVNVFVDGGTGPGDAGAYTLTTTFTPAVCGDNVLTTPEECDDGNVLGMDGCDVTCKFLPQAEVEPNNDAVTAGSVFEGKVTAGITPAMDNDWFTVTVPGPMSTLKVTTGASGSDICMSENGGVGTIDTEVEIFGPNGMMSLQLNDDINGSAGPDGNYCSTATAMSLAAGTYYVRAAASTMYCPMCEFDYSIVISVD